MSQYERGKPKSREWLVDLPRRELRANGVVVPIGSRAFEIVAVLALSDGELVTKEDLVRSVWPDAVVVEDGTIRIHISAIRKVLGPDREMLETVPAQGYRLRGNWTVRQDRDPAKPDFPERAEPEQTNFSTNVPLAASTLVGREAAVQRLLELTSAYRSVTLTGPGGIGKTVLAAEVARKLFPDLESDIFFVELAALSDPQLVPSAVASALGLRPGGEEISPASVARAIAGKKTLLILDNCEHVIDAAAGLAETLLRLCPHARVLATSREVLRIEGEFVYHVAPLDVPSDDQAAPNDILGRSAVQLFVRRTGSLPPEILTHPENLAAIASIVRRLDGIPLAIEFAAARAATFGVAEVARRLDDRFALLTGGRRTALARHQTLRATLDWSYELLPESEQQLLRRLAVFSGGFTREAVVGVMADTGYDPSAVIDGIANLLDKSLIARAASENGARWRLLETARAYALARLQESGEAAPAARGHAAFYRDLFAAPQAEGQNDLSRRRGEVDNLRTALNWAFSPDGDTVLGVELAAAAADFWGAMSLLAEAGEWSAKALAQLGDAAGTRHEMILQCSLGLALIYTSGMIAPAREALTRARALAEALGDFDYQQRTTHDLWLFFARSAYSREALALARQYEELARTRDRETQAVADWIVGIPLTYMAAHGEAAERLRRAIDQYPADRRSLDLVRFGADLRASASAHLTVNLLSLGHLDAATRTALFSIEEARGAGNLSTMCISLAWAAGFVFLSLDEWDRAEEFGEELIDCAYKHSLRPFHAAGLCVRGSLAAKRGAPEAGIDLLRTGLAGMKEASYLLFYPFYMAELAIALGTLSRIDEGIAELDAALTLAAEIEYRWFVPELLRVKGEVLAARPGADGDAVVEDLFRQSMRQAAEQQALYWELCGAASLAKLLRDQRRDAEARAVLGPVYDRMTEGHSTSRINRIKTLLA